EPSLPPPHLEHRRVVVDGVPHGRRDVGLEEAAGAPETGRALHEIPEMVAPPRVERLPLRPGSGPGTVEGTVEVGHDGGEPSRLTVRRGGGWCCHFSPQAPLTS